MKSLEDWDFSWKIVEVLSEETSFLLRASIVVTCDSYRIVINALSSKKQKQTYSVMTVKLLNLRNSAYTCQYTGISHFNHEP